MSTNKTLGEAGLGELIDILKNELANAGSSVPTITIALSQVVGQDPLQVQLTNEQYDALASSQIAIVDATAVGISAIISIFKTHENDSAIHFMTTVYSWSNDGVWSSHAFAAYVDKSTKILTQYEGTFYAGLYETALGWNPSVASGNLTPTSPQFIENVFSATFAYSDNMISGSTLSDAVIRDYVLNKLPIEINGALCYFLNNYPSTNNTVISRYFTATMNGALVHLNIIEINTSTWVVTFNQVDVNSGGGGTSATATTVSIATSDWSNGTCTKNVTGVTATNIVIVEPSDVNVQCTAQGAGTLTFTASETPTTTVTVKVVILS